MSKSEQYCIYRIVCTVTGKCYVGQTCEVNKRRRVHFSRLNKGTHHSKHLQRAYRIYGASFFYFEILEKGIDKDDVNTQEIYWIDHFDSYKNGFNATRDGRVASPAGIPCTWNGVTYSSMKEAARVTGISQTTLYHRIKRGFTSDDDMRTAKYCEWNGIIYESIKEAARACGITENAMGKRLSIGYTCDADVKGRWPMDDETENDNTYLTPIE